MQHSTSTMGRPIGPNEGPNYEGTWYECDSCQRDSKGDSEHCRWCDFTMCQTCFDEHRERLHRPCAGCGEWTSECVCDEEEGVYVSDEPHSSDCAFWCKEPCDCMARFDPDELLDRHNDSLLEGK